ncbi:MAG: hypothetical protein PWQ67_614 [Clostridia bacterium]|nr:hypothetical protein [Clostridia bacterium]
MKIKPWVMGLVIFIFIFGGVSLSAAMNLWRTTSSKIPAKYKQGEFAGSYNPADIRGSYTFGDVSRLFIIPLEDLGKGFGLNDVKNLASVQIKELETRYENLKTSGVEIGTDSVRMFVALYKGLPYTINESSYLLGPAVDILKTQGNLTDEQSKYLDNHLVELSQIKTTTLNNNTIKTNEQEYEKIVKGKTTFKEVLDWGLYKKDIEEVLGKKMPNPLMTIRDFCTNEGMEFSVIKKALQEKIDNLK